MPSTPTPDEADPHDIFVIEPDVVFASRADKPLPRSWKDRHSQEKPAQDKPSPVRSRISWAIS